MSSIREHFYEEIKNIKKKIESNESLTERDIQILLVTNLIEEEKNETSNMQK